MKKNNVTYTYEDDFEDDEDENPNNEFCHYHCKLNLNRIYDEYVLWSKFDLKPISLFHLESLNNNSLYSTGFA